MATIKSQLALNDGMSAVLKKINSALNLTLTSFEQVQRASGAAIDNAAISEARAGLVEANRVLDEMEEHFSSAAKEEEKLNNSIHAGTSAANGLLKKVTSIATKYMDLSKAKAFVTDSLKAADIQLDAQVHLNTVMGNMGTLNYYDDVLAKASEIQSKGIYSDEAMIAGAAELSTYFSDGEAILSMMDSLSNYAMGMSNGGELDSKAMANFATGIGKIMTGSYDAMPKKGSEFSDVQKAIIEGTATNAQIVETLGEEYVNLSNDMQAAAVIGAVIEENWAGLYETMSNTPRGKIIQLKHDLGSIKEEIGAGVYPAVLSFISAFRDNLPQIREAALSFAHGVGVIITCLAAAISLGLGFALAVRDNWSILAPIILGVAVALGIYKGVLLAVNAVEAISNGLTAASNGLKAIAAARSAIKAGATIAEAAATKTATGSQVGLNAALLACPITWIIIAIIALIAVFYAAIAAVNKFADTSRSATGIICGAFTVAVAFIWDLCLGLFELVIGIFNALVNPILAFVNFFANVFNDPVGSVIHLFGDLADNVLGVLQKIASAMDFVFGSDMADTVQGWRDGLSDMVNRAAKEYGNGEYEKVVSALDLSVEDLGLSRIAYSNAWSAGYSFGEGVGNKLGSGYNAGTMDDLMQQTMSAGSALDGMAGDIGEIADNTAASAESQSMTEEQLKYLHDIAERDAINRFTTAEVKIDMTGMTNRIDSSQDLDGVISRLTDGFAEALVTASEGVHA